MRIIAGDYKGRQFKTTVGPGYRPAMGKVRGALFSMLEAQGVAWREARVLDLFAGSGSLGFEALSRGAGEVVFVEAMAKAAALIRENADKFGVEPGRIRVVQDEVGKMLNHPPLQPFDVIFIDPPYGMRLLHPALKAIMKRGWLAESGIINAEIEAGLKMAPESEHPELTVLADRRYGQTRVVLWSRKADA